MICDRCEKRVKDWKGDDPRCAFTRGQFDSDNWNCATMNDLRELVRDRAVYSEDNNCAVLPYEGYFIIISWYKSRGCTNFAAVLDGCNVRALTTVMADEILKFAKKEVRS